MGRSRKTEKVKLVNVGVRISPEIKQALTDEYKTTGIAEGTLARNYMLLGMQVAREGRPDFNSVLSRIVEILRSCPPSIQLQALGIAQLLAGQNPSPPPPPSDGSLYPADEEQVEILGQQGNG